MRRLVFSILVATPLVLAAWIGWRGGSAPPAETPTAAAGQAGAHAAAAPVAPADEDGALKALYAEGLAGAKVSGQLALYDAKGLFDYIDGAAPIFIERNFRKLAAAEMTSADGSELTCDVYDMRTEKDAQSIFDKERSASAKPVEGFPGEAIAGSMSFVFHAGRYYVKLTAFDAKAEAALPAVARALHERMSGAKPAAAAAPAAVADEDGALKALYADGLAGAKVSGQLALYDTKGLFDYIDGAAPIFIERNFRKLAAAEMTSAGGSELTCDVYDMRTAKDAQSIFEKERSASAKKVEGFTAEAIAGSMSFVFHADRYYVKLTAFDAKAEAALPDVARELRKRMP